VDDVSCVACNHSGPHSGAARYERNAARLRLVLVCDRCGAEQNEFGNVGYRPQGRRFVGQLAEWTARELELSEPQIARVRFAALVCDVGRDRIPAEILNKRGPLTDEEWVEVRRQPELGAALLSDTSFDDIRDWIANRRERPDGNGYPRGLSAAEVPLEARILAVVDAYVAMRSDRAHRPARPHHEATAELLDGAGTQFDASVVAAFVRAATLHLPAVRTPGPGANGGVSRCVATTAAPSA
jgi:response regulator RpfG family c-di-GMP phosphodiesterase